MKVQFLQQATNSFFHWLDHELLENGEAYSNQTGAFYRYSDQQIPDGYSCFGSAYKQWVADSSITGANIPTGVYANGSLVGRSSDTVIDFDNGRVISSEISSSAAVTGAFAVKDFSLYTTNDDEESLVLDVVSKTENERRIGSDLSYTYVKPYDLSVPAIFVAAQTQENDPFALGGLDETVIRFNTTIFCHTKGQLDGAISFMADLARKTFYELPFDSSPYTEYGDVKNGVYNYNNTIDTSAAPYYVRKAKGSKLADSVRRNLSTALYIGFVDFEVCKVRNPRA